MGESLRQDVLANNLANADTAGFKRAVATNQTLASMVVARLQGDGRQGPPAPLGTVGLGAQVASTAYLFTQGGLKPTGNDMDLAVMGDGFFAVETPNGVRYTRDGAFTLDADGYLTTAAGLRVLGEQGPLQPGAGRMEIAASGEVSVDGQAKGKLRLTAFADNGELVREGQNLYRAPEGAGGPAKASVKTGHLELSNVQAVREMVELINVMRSYEAGQRLIQVQDETLGKAVNEVAGR